MKRITKLPAVTALSIGGTITSILLMVVLWLEVFR